MTLPYRPLAFWAIVCLGASPLEAQRADLLSHAGITDLATLERMIMVPMRDGIRLSTAVIRPKTVSGPLPTVLIRTPYLKDGELERGGLAVRFIREGYAIVIQNERGTEWSEGKHQFLAGARDDGSDALSWIAAQPWSNGKVGMIGCSSSAEDQLAVASTNHPALKAIIPMSAGAGIGDIPGVSSQGLFYKGGVPQIGPWTGWYAEAGHANRPKLPPDLSREELGRLYDFYSPFPKAENERFGVTSVAGALHGTGSTGGLAHLPSGDILKAAGVPETDYDRFVTLSPADPHWRTIDFIHDGDRPLVPALHVNGWHDVGAFETIKLFEYLKDVPNQFLIMAPTSHCAMLAATAKHKVGERFVGNAKLPYEDLFVKWFDQWLKDKPSDILARPKVQVFLEGANTWTKAGAWPVPGTTAMKFFLHGDGHGQTRRGTGSLSIKAPGSELPDAFVSDPMKPVPSRGGGCCDRDAVRDQRLVEDRKDVLVFSSEPLRAGVAAIGEVRAVLFVSASTPDADIAVKLIDVYPDGQAFNLYDTLLRLRYRDGFDRAVPMKPGEVYRAEITGLVAGNYFGVGHRIRIEVAGSNFPNFERNMQTGGKNYDEVSAQVATIRIHHDRASASYIELATIPR